MIDYAGPYPVPNKTLHEWVMEGDRWVRFFLPLSLDVLISVDGIDGMNELALEVIGYDGIGELCYGIQGLATDDEGQGADHLHGGRPGPRRHEGDVPG